VAPEIRLPYHFQPRDYQIPLWRAFDEGQRRLLTVWHRRAGKDKCCLNLLIRAMMMRTGLYFYLLPTYSQARKIIWNGIDGSGFRFLNHFPRELIEGKPNETEMRIRLKNGSVFQLVGSDNIDSIVGTNPVGCVFSEFSLQDPRGWDFIRPILRENGGWSLFNGTPRGKSNHLHTLYQMAINNPEWYVEKLDVLQTGVLTPEDLQAERDAGMSEELIQQEFMCSFEGGMEGAYYISHMNKMAKQHRIASIPHMEDLPVHTAWDVGVDTTAIIFFQLPPGGMVNIIDYHEGAGEGIQTFTRFVRDKAQEEGYEYGEHIAGWDIVKRQYGQKTAQSTKQIAARLGVKFKAAPKLKVDDGITSVQAMLSRVNIDAVKCERLINALYTYRRKQDRVTRDYLPMPVHDWSSHGCDALRYLATGRRNSRVEDTPPDRYARRSRQNRHSGQTWQSM